MEFNSYNSWDPLKEVLLGSVYPVGFFDDIKDPKTRDALTKVNEETREDLDSAVKVLEGLGVKVHRTPEVKHRNGKIIASAGEHIELSGQIPKPEIAPRDEFMVIGDTLYTNMQGPEWHKKEYMHGKVIKTSPDVTYPSIMRCGKDINVDVHPGNAGTKKFACEIMPQHNITNNTNFRVNTIEMGGHNDGVMSLVKPGLIISHNNVDTSKMYPDWERIVVPTLDTEYTRAFWEMKRQSRDVSGMKKYWIANEEGNRELHKFIDLWMNKNVGYAYETLFDVNCLSVSENVLLCNSYNPELQDILAKKGVELISSPMRHRWFWDAGFHCVTVDLVREGGMQDYFPNRDTSLDLGRPWKDNELRRPIA